MSKGAKSTIGKNRDPFILLIENAFEDAQFFSRTVQEGVSDLLTVQTIRTEREFHSRFANIAEGSPPLAVFSTCLLPWDSPSPTGLQTPPLELEGFTGGIRCLRLLASDPRTANLPLVLYSHLDVKDTCGLLKNLPGVSFFSKAGSDRTSYLDA